MKLEVERIHEYAGKNFAERKYVEGQHVLWSGFVVKCGSLQDNGSADPNLVKIHSECVQSSHIRDEVPFIVTGEIQKDGKVSNFMCSCPAGDSEQCKHIMATLLHCYFKGEDLPVLSKTDVSCSWSKLRDETLKKFKSMPIEDHPCFYGQMSDEIKRRKKVFQRPRRVKKKFASNSIRSKKVLGESNILNTMNDGETSQLSSSCAASSPESLANTEESPSAESNKSSVQTTTKRKQRDGHSETYIVSQWKKFKAMPEFSEQQMTEMLVYRDEQIDSGLMKEIAGRHEGILTEEFSKVTDYDRQVYKIIFENQSSNLLESIALFKVPPLQSCCESVLAKLNKDPLLICENTRNHFADWSEERMYRVTGTSVYPLHTYCNGNHSPEDWKNKIENFITPKDFHSESTEYGLKHEAPAREVFKLQNPEFEVIETGLIICKQQPWISCSPDGVILYDGKVVSLLEIKCFTKGKNEGIEAVVEHQIQTGCLRRDKNGTILLREKNRYYGQVQLGMAVLNVDNFKFVLYSSFDKKIFVVNVAKDALFLRKMLTRQKELYYKAILPEICLLESNDEKSSPHADRKHLTLQFENIEAKRPKSQSKPKRVKSDSDPKPGRKPRKPKSAMSPKKTKPVLEPKSPKSSKVRL